MAKLNLPQLIKDLNTGHEIALALINRIDIAFEDLVANMSKEDHAFTSDDAARYYDNIYTEPVLYEYTNSELYRVLLPTKVFDRSEKEDITMLLLQCPVFKSYHKDPLDVLQEILDEGEDNEDYQPPRKEDYTPVK